MNKAANLLMHEHNIIQGVIESSINVLNLSESKPNLYENSMKELVIFFREYADKFHHHKEELILFPKISSENAIIGEALIPEMIDNHEDFREYIRKIENFVSTKQFTKSNETFKLYMEKLLDHIAVENDELFQMFESLFNDEEIEKMYHSFIDSDMELGLDRKEELEKTAIKMQRLISEST